MIAVVATADDAIDVVEPLLPATGRIARGGGRAYRFYALPDDQPIRNTVYPDLDGSPLTEIRCFATIAEAEAWVADNFRRHPPTRQQRRAAERHKAKHPVPSRIYTTDDFDFSEPFDPEPILRQLGACCLCGQPVAIMGVFVPTTQEAKAMVLRLRRHAQPTEAGLVYGLCVDHWHADHDTMMLEVEAVFEAAAARTVVQ